MPRPPIQHHKHIIEIGPNLESLLDPDSITGGILSKFDSGKIPRTRIIGAAVAAAGVYTMTRLVIAFGRDIAGHVKAVTSDIFTEISVPIINIFTSIFGIQVEKKEGVALQIPDQILKDLSQFDPFAFGAALAAGGMVLAGLNPGEILQGIGSIIDGLVPL